MNTYTKIIDNCLDCEYHYVKPVWTADSFEHERGVYCIKLNNKIVAENDWNLRKYSQIPDWCPMLKEGKKWGSQ